MTDKDEVRNGGGNFKTIIYFLLIKQKNTKIFWILQ